MNLWRSQLIVDPIHNLIELGNPAIRFFVERDLLEIAPGVGIELWKMPEAASLVRRQQSDGRWMYPGNTAREKNQEDYDQIETYRNLGILVEKYGFTSNHPAVEAAASYLFSCQSREGDFRGIYGQQYSPNYTGGIMELLIKAGFQDDKPIQRGFEWLLSIRQDDGGWAIPIRTLGLNLQQMYSQDRPLLPDRSKPFSHLVTGVVVRAFASHPVWRNSEIARQTASMLAQRFFKPDDYIDRKNREYWERVSYPFWFTDIVSALDSLTLVGIQDNLPEVRGAIEWLGKKQTPDGNFDLRIVHGKDRHIIKYWITLAICRIFKRYYQGMQS